MNNLLAKVQNGMKVYDQAQNEVGTVDYVQLGDEDPLRPGPQIVTGSPAQGERGNWMMNTVSDVFQSDELPDILKERLLRYGFIRVDSNDLIDAERYIFPNQVKSVDGNRVTLNVTRSELIQRM